MRHTASYLLAVVFAACGIGTALAHDDDDRPPPRHQPADPGLGNIQELTRRLVGELGDLQEDITIEVPGPRGKELYQQAGTVLDEATHLQKAVQTNASPEHLQKHIAEMDQDLRKLLDGIAALGRDGRPLQRSASRINYMEQQLNGTLAQGNPSGDSGQEVVVRQIHLLSQQAQEFNRVAQFVAQNNPNTSGQLADDSSAFAEAAEHFHKALEAGFNQEHLQRDFAKVNEAWGRVVTDLQSIPRNRVLLAKASQVSAIYQNLFGQLKVGGERVQIRDRD